MKVKGIIEEDFVNYKKPSLYIAMPYCTFKCGEELCQNSSLAREEIIDVDIKKLVDNYIENPITKAVVFGGLEPLDSWNELVNFLMEFRYRSGDPIVIYTGYNKDELGDKINTLKLYSPILIKYGRYIPNQESHYDELLGVNLASSNQYAEWIALDYRATTNIKLFDTIHQKLRENGGYCPCRLEKTDDTKCICKDFRNQLDNKILGKCHCGLYEAVNPYE